MVTNEVKDGNAMQCKQEQCNAMQCNQEHDQALTNGCLHERNIHAKEVSRPHNLLLTIVDI